MDAAFDGVTGEVKRCKSTRVTPRRAIAHGATFHEWRRTSEGRRYVGRRAARSGASHLLREFESLSVAYPHARLEVGQLIHATCDELSNAKTFAIPGESKLPSTDA